MANPGELSPHAGRNRQAWDSYSDEYQSQHGAQLRESGGLGWGTWQRPEAELGVLGDLAGRSVLEFGGGAAKWSIALAKRGVDVTGLDLSERQLEHARKLMDAAGVDFRLVHGSAESTPFADASFDVVFCDWGAMSFADPYRTVPEAARLLRGGGLLAFCTGTPLVECAWPAGAEEPGEQLVNDYWGLHQIESDDMVVFELPYGEWIRVFNQAGFVVESLIELRPPADAVSSYRGPTARDWARRWPMENIWRARRLS